MDGLRTSVVVVMGVSGSDKTTIGALLADRLSWPFADCHDFHPPADIEKMDTGIPLTDEDRWPRLRAIAAWIEGAAPREAMGWLGARHPGGPTRMCCRATSP